MQKDTVKNTEKLKWHMKKCLSNPKIGRKGETQE